MNEDRNENPPEKLAPEPASGRRVNPFLLLGFLLGPAVVALLGSLAKIDVIAVGSPLVGAGIGAVICGIMMGRRYGRGPLSKAAIGILSAILFGCVSLGIGMFGCSIGGFGLG